MKASPIELIKILTELHCDRGADLVRWVWALKTCMPGVVEERSEGVKLGYMRPGKAIVASFARDGRTKISVYLDGEEKKAARVYWYIGCGVDYSEVIEEW